MMIGRESHCDTLDDRFFRCGQPLVLAVQPIGKGGQQFQLLLQAKAPDQPGIFYVLVALPGVEQRLTAFEIKFDAAVGQNPIVAKYNGNNCA